MIKLGPLDFTKRGKHTRVNSVSIGIVSFKQLSNR
ncbi:unnamed protein product [Brassica napus]|uniref:(rape) hypothetical protein n=1 Tax=Brassica napus TaxID=3708 RepID=A0A816XHV7_BRANA|nr:unnamed protein product [Brassica napus]